MKEMDRILRNKLQDHTSDMPTDMWSRIEIGMQEEKKVRGLFLYLLSGLAFLGFITVSYFGYNHFASSDLTDSPVVLNESVNINSELEEQHTSLETLKETINTDQIPKNESQGLTLPTQNSPSDQSYTSKSAPVSELDDAVDSKLKLDVYDKERSTVEFIPENQSEKLSETANSESLMFPKEIEEQKTPKVADLDFLNKVDWPLIFDEQRTFGDPVGCPTFSSRAPLNLYVEAHYSPLSAMKMITSNSPEIGPEYIDLRKNSESALYSWSAGVNIGYISPYNIGFRAGLNYEVINERFVYEDPQAIRNQTIIVIDTIFNPDGTTTVNADTSVIQVAGFETLRIHNYHKSVEIPLHLTYYLDMRGIDFEISGGPNININYTNRGKIVDPSNEDQWFTNGENGGYKVFRDRLAVSLSLSISAMYNVNEKIQLYARPHFKFQPTSMTVNSSPFNQKYAIVGLAAGARYYFSGNPNY